MSEKTTQGSLDSVAMVTAQRFVRHGSRGVALAAALSFLGAALYAVTWKSESGFHPVAAVPWFAGLAVFGLSIVLGLPALFAGTRDLFRRNRGKVAAKLLLFFGPLVVFVGMELLPHLINPCTITEAIGRPTLPQMCEEMTYRSGFQGEGKLVTDFDIKDRWHPLSHSLFGAIPLAALYGLALRKRKIDADA
ncbi:MAG TPA: hypothetical protein VI541_02685 [Actinomycetota bacterium]|nr:hypothetical protein [Actinomycetota bacterium]